MRQLFGLSLLAVLVFNSILVAEPGTHGPAAPTRPAAAPPGPLQWQIQELQKLLQEFGALYTNEIQSLKALDHDGAFNYLVSRDSFQSSIETLGGNLTLENEYSMAIRLRKLTRQLQNSACHTGAPFPGPIPPGPGPGPIQPPPPLGNRMEIHNGSCVYPGKQTMVFLVGGQIQKVELDCELDSSPQFYACGEVVIYDPGENQSVSGYSVFYKSMEVAVVKTQKFYSTTSAINAGLELRDKDSRCKTNKK